ncbi:MAG: M10 family metallopeptidase [Planctomycetota bacterium]|nr:M10 family metallopeptidase [Planctomycetota bacterium]
MNNFDPIIDVQDSIIRLGDSVQLTSISSVFDQDGDPIGTYRFFDPSGGGFFTLNGVNQAVGSYFDVDADEISFLRYHAGASVGSEVVRALVYDGERWGTEDLATMYSVTAPTRRPVVTADSNFDVVAYEKVPMADYFSATDPDGYPIIRYKFKDARVTSGGGQMEHRGSRIQQGQWVYVRAEHLDQAFYYGALNSHNENILVRAYDGTKWSPVERIDAVTTRNANRPIVTNSTFTIRSETSVPMIDTFVVRDEDMSTMKKYRFLDTRGSQNSGYVEVNGVRKPSNRWFTIDAEDISGAKFVASQESQIENVRVRVWDGRFWSQIRTIEFKSIPDPTLITEDNVVLDEFEAIPMTSIVTGQADEGPRIVDYEFIDMNTNPLSGFMELDGNRLAAGEVHNLSQGELERLQFIGGANHRRTWDEVKVRANSRAGVNSFFVGEWKNINIKTEPNAETSLIAPSFGGDFRNTWHDWIAPQADGSMRLTFSFMQVVPAYYGDISPDPPEEPLPVPNQNQRDSIRTALARFGELLDIDFVEVSDNFEDPLTGATGGIIRFGTHFDPEADWSAFAYFPSDVILAPHGGDIWINNAIPNNFFSPGPGSQSFLTIMHEIGHAIGTHHPHELPPGKTVLSADIDHDGMSVMSYVPNPNGTVARNLMLYDSMYMGSSYGFNPDTRPGDDTYTWNASRFQDMVYDSDGIDTIDASNQTFGADIFLQEGEYSSIGSADENVVIAYGTSIENAIGTNNTDTLWGNELDNELRGRGGDDVLNGAGGDDHMFGGSGDDRYIYEVGDQHEIYDEERSTGRDVVEVRLGNRFGLDNFSEDISFERLGRDLRINFLTDGDDFRSGSVTIKDQIWGGSRIETLRMFNDDGSQNGVSIDLTSAFVQSSGTPTYFEATGTRGQYGFLVTPVA